jgi:hypothetical protein
VALARWQATIVDSAGNVQAGASVTVQREVIGSPLANLFEDRDGLVPTGNPITADADGFAFFHVAGGAYRVTASKGGFTREWRYVALGTLAEQDSEAPSLGNLGITGFIDLAEIAAPANPDASVARLYAFDDGGVTRIGIRDAAGAVTAIGSGIFLPASTPISWNAGDVTIAHSANALAFAGASNGYSFDAAINGTPLSASVQSTGLNGIDGDQFFIFKTYTDAPGVGGHPSSEIAVLRVQRHADYTGGTFGNVENAIWARHTVEAGVANFEWSILAQLENHATAGENVALYARADKMSGAGPTWAATYAAQDFNNNPTSQLVGQEIGMFANGGDSNLARVGLDIVAGKRDTGGATATIGVGLRIGPQNSDAANGVFTYGMRLDKTFSIGINMSDADCSTADIVTKGGVLFGGLSAKPTTSGGTVTPTLAAAGIGSITGANYSADGTPTIFTLAKSRNATKGSHTIVQSGDILGDIRFEGSDGTNFVRGAAIRATVEGTPGTSDMPTVLQFMTSPDGSASPVEGFRVRSDQQLQFQAASFAANGAGTVTITNVRPAGAATATITRWLSFRDEAGVDSYIPVWQ